MARQFLAMFISSAASFIPHLLFGAWMSTTTDFIVGSFVGLIAYAWALYKLRNM